VENAKRGFGERSTRITGSGGGELGGKADLGTEFREGLDQIKIKHVNCDSKGEDNGGEGLHNPEY